MGWLTFGITLASWGCLLLVANRCARAVRRTSLITAWCWLLGAGLAVCMMAVTDWLAGLWPDRMSDYGWCMTAILLICPPMAVLGARRPGVRVWSLFILLPMVAVLSWPIWTLLLQGSELRGLALEPPTVMGLTLVLVMGTGNFLGTRFAFSAVLYFAGVLALFMTCTGWAIMPENLITPWRLGSIAALEIAVLGVLASAGPKFPRQRVNRLWDDFRDLFGLVWALRMVERINALAVQEKWTIRMTLDGFPENATGQLTENEAEVEAACHWLFRRFVDDEWITERLGPSTEKSQTESETGLAATAPLR